MSSNDNPRGGQGSTALRNRRTTSRSGLKHLFTIQVSYCLTPSLLESDCTHKKVIVTHSWQNSYMKPYVYSIRIITTLMYSTWNPNMLFEVVFEAPSS